MSKTHTYTLTLRWTGNNGEGTASYQSYQRDFQIDGMGKPSIAGSADPDYRGDVTRWNPEELLVAALSACHKLWFLHLATTAGIVVTDYVDAPIGTMVTGSDGSGEFTSCVLRPTITMTGAHEQADAIHSEASSMCFIARSVNFPVTVKARYASS